MVWKEQLSHLESSFQVLFLELIQVALGSKEWLSKNPSEEEWNYLFLTAQKQAVSGLAFNALEKLSMYGQKPPIEILFNWIAQSQHVKNRNSYLDKKCKEAQGLLMRKGIKSSILKGQGIALSYEDSLRPLRQSGDIDIYVDCGRNKAISIAEKLQGKEVHWDYKHLQLHLSDDVIIEMHYRVEVLFNLLKNKKLQNWFSEHEAWLYCEKDGLIVPNEQFNVFYILLHIYRHFFLEGIGLRQIIDYYYVLKAGNFNKTESVKTLKEFGLLRFAQGIMWVLQKTLGLEREFILCAPSEKEGRFILKQIMLGGNFGHYDKRICRYDSKLGYVYRVMAHNFHLLFNYPSEVLWAPVWLVWHKCWKMIKSWIQTLKQI